MTVTVTGASGDVTVTPSQLTFVSDGDSDNAWFKARPVTVSAAKDGDAEIDAAVTLGHTVRGGDYDRLRGVDSVRVTIRESQTKGITVDTTGMDIPEGQTGIPEGQTGTYTVKLNSQPTGTVTVMVRGASGDVTVRPSRLTFTTSTWDEEQEVEVNAGQDADAESDAAVRLTHAASGGGYNGVTGGEVTVIIREDDTGTKGRGCQSPCTHGHGGIDSGYVHSSAENGADGDGEGQIDYGVLGRCGEAVFGCSPNHADFHSAQLEHSAGSDGEGGGGR